MRTFSAELSLSRFAGAFKKLNVRKILPQQLLHNGMLAWLLLVTGLFVVLFAASLITHSSPSAFPPGKRARARFLGGLKLDS